MQIHLKRVIRGVRKSIGISLLFEKPATRPFDCYPKVVTVMVSLVVLLSLLPTAASAQVVWTQAEDSASKSATRQPLAFDSKRGVTVSFGGCSGEGLGLPHGDTWEWNGAKWKRVSTTGPSPRQSRALVYDSAREVTVLFGGFVCGAAAPDNFVEDTWEWDGGTWTQVATSGPSPRVAPMVYDSARGVSVLFGGVGSSELSDTWEWDGERWTQVSSTGPGPRYNVFNWPYRSGRHLGVGWKSVEAGRCWWAAGSQPARYGL
jgi:hypothetical protein